MNVICPKCKTEFEIPHYDVDDCPSCGNGLLFDEMCTQDYDDCWTVILWESNNYEY